MSNNNGTRYIEAEGTFDLCYDDGTDVRLTIKCRCHDEGWEDVQTYIDEGKTEVTIYPESNPSLLASMDAHIYDMWYAIAHSEPDHDGDTDYGEEIV